MGFASDYSGPSYIKAKMVESSSWDYAWGEVHVYRWDLTLDRSKVSSGERVDVYASFTGLPAGTWVALHIFITGSATMTCDHTPILSHLPPGGKSPGDAWVFQSGYIKKGLYLLLFRLDKPDERLRLGYLTVT